jgi:hypothetical protein
MRRVKMHWNHRVVEMDNGDGDKWYQICEVHYDENDKPIGYCDTFVGSETLEGLRGEIARFSEAVAHPILKTEDFKESV